MTKTTTNAILKNKFCTTMTIEESKLTGYATSNIEGRPRINLNNLNPDTLIKIINIDGKYPLIEFI